tara:strand:- start:11 stop:304 length:294 start_codon:yes stop_codon:yes gene_type:complete
MTEVTEEKFAVDVETIHEELRPVLLALEKVLVMSKQAQRILDVGGHDTAITVASKMTRVQCEDMVAVIAHANEAKEKLIELIGNWKMGIGLGDQSEE